LDEAVQGEVVFAAPDQGVVDQSADGVGQVEWIGHLLP